METDVWAACRWACVGRHADVLRDALVDSSGRIKGDWGGIPKKKKDSDILGLKYAAYSQVWRVLDQRLF